MANRSDFLPIGRRSGLLRRMVGNLVTAFAPPAAAPAVPPSVSLPAIPEFVGQDYAETVRAILVGRPGGPLRQVAEWMRANGVPLCWDRAAPSTLLALAQDRALTHAFVVLDEMGGIDGALEDLLRLRRARPDLVVILISNDFGHDEFGTHRLPLCDASLRPPIGFFALEFALQEATEVNNPLWLARQKDLSHG